MSKIAPHRLYEWSPPARQIFSPALLRACAHSGDRSMAAQTKRRSKMLGQIHREGDDGSRFIEAAKDKKSGRRLMGFGHRVYKNYDPRAKLIKKQFVVPLLVYFLAPLKGRSSQAGLSDFHLGSRFTPGKFLCSGRA